MNSIFVWIALSLASGIACYAIARKKGKDAALWFIAGVIFNIFALVIITKASKVLEKTKHQKQGGG